MIPRTTRWTRTLEDIDTIKQHARESAYEARARAHGSGIGAARRAAAHVLAAVAGLRDVSVVSGYLPIRSEIDPRPAMLALHGLGLRICVPVIQAKDKPLLFRAWTPAVALRPGPFAVPVPVEGDWLEPDLLLVPLLAFDEDGNRLGYGGGFYDRTLEALRAVRPIHGYGLAYEAQKVAEVPRSATDAPLDAVVTEAGIRPTRPVAPRDS